MKKISFLISISFLIVFCNYCYASSPLSPNRLLKTMPVMMTVASDESSWEDEGFIGIEIDISDYSSKEKAEELKRRSYIRGHYDVDIFITDAEEKVKVLNEIRSWHDRSFGERVKDVVTLGFSFWDYEIKVERQDGSTYWYNVDNWDGMVYEKKLQDESTAIGWNNLRYDPRNVPGFSERGLPEPPDINDFPESFKRYFPTWRENAEAIRKRVDEDSRYANYSSELTNERLQIIWDVAKDIDIDPFIFLAILVEEGNGSFNTHIIFDGEEYHFGRPHPIFEDDARMAARIIDRGIKRWEASGDPKNKGWLYWVNMGTDKINFDGTPVFDMGYCELVRWHLDVIWIYNNIFDFPER